VRFAIEADREGRSVAAQLEVLPKGSVSFFEVPPPPRETTLCPVSTGRRTRRVQLVRGEGRDLSG